MIIIEGIDGTGKTTIANFLVNLGMFKYHFGYDTEHKNLYEKYLNAANSIDTPDKVIMDRSFITELVYGDILREQSRISKEEAIHLFKRYNEQGCIILYLTASKNTLLQRRRENKSDFTIIENHYDALVDKYNEIISIAKKYIKVYQLTTD